MTYQNVAGSLTPGAHPGSYNGQDAYNDMLVTNNVLERNEHSRYADEPKRGGGRKGCLTNKTSTV